MTTESATLARDTGASLALDAETHKFELEQAISWAARSFREFSSDDIHYWLENHGVELAHPNSVGASFLCAARAGIIKNTGRVQKSTRTEGRRRAIAVWRSLISVNHLEPEKPCPAISLMSSPAKN